MNIKSFSPQNLALRGTILLHKMRGLDLLPIIMPHQSGLDPMTAYGSAPSGDKYLERLFSDFNISSQDSIIDIGSGKGSAMRTMLKFPFKQVDGIELSENIANIAIRNFEKLKLTRNRVFIGNASQFTEYDNYNIVYFFNPFPSSVMSDVIDRLIDSIGRSDREMIIIYNYVTCNETIIKKGVFSQMGLYPSRWNNMPLTIYSNRSYNDSRLLSNKNMQKEK